MFLLPLRYLSVSDYFRRYARSPPVSHAHDTNTVIPVMLPHQHSEIVNVFEMAFSR
jgi:hypothetical protein